MRLGCFLALLLITPARADQVVDFCQQQRNMLSSLAEGLVYIQCCDQKMQECDTGLSYDDQISCLDTAGSYCMVSLNIWESEWQESLFQCEFNTKQQP